MKRALCPAIVALVLVAAAGAGSAGEDQAKATRAAGLDPAAVKAITEMGSDIEKLEASHRILMEAVGALEGLYAKLARKAEEVSRLAPDAGKAKGDAEGRLIKAAREMREMQQSFSLQYLQIQNKIAHENRQFSMVSNIMKNKHDTAKNAISNVR